MKGCCTYLEQQGCGDDVIRQEADPKPAVDVPGKNGEQDLDNGDGHPQRQSQGAHQVLQGQGVVQEPAVPQVPLSDSRAS